MKNNEHQPKTSLPYDIQNMEENLPINENDQPHLSIKSQKESKFYKNKYNKYRKKTCLLNKEKEKRNRN